jgi:hypothetical protein
MVERALPAYTCGLTAKTRVQTVDWNQSDS